MIQKVVSCVLDNSCIFLCLVFTDSMTRIYINTLLDVEELNEDNFCESFEAYAKKLENMAKLYKKFSKYLKTKDVKILNADGFPHSGSFDIDDIDVARLKKAGFVVDHAEEDGSKDQVFYIDEKLDALIEQAMSNKQIAQMVIPVHPDDEEASDHEHDHDHDHEDEDGEYATLVNLLDVCNPDIDGANIRADTVLLGFAPVSEDKVAFEFRVNDFNQHEVTADFDRETQTFTYKCDSCEEEHQKEISQLYKSLKTATALIGNLAIMSTEHPELAAALDTIDDELRMLQKLLSFDYAIEDDDDDLPGIGEDIDEDDTEGDSDASDD